MTDSERPRASLREGQKPAKRSKSDVFAKAGAAQTTFAFRQQKLKLQPHQREIVGCSEVVNLPQNILTELNEVSMRKR